MQPLDVAGGSKLILWSRLGEAVFQTLEAFYSI